MPATDNPWLIFAGLIVTLLSAIGIKDIVLSLLKRKPRRAVEVTSQIELAKQAQAYAEQLEQDAAASRASAQQAWAAVTEANRKLVRAYQRLDESTWKFEQAARYLDSIVAKVFDPDSDIEMVRNYISSRPIPFDRSPIDQSQEGL